MGEQGAFVGPGPGMIERVLGVPVTFVLSDHPWSFRVRGGGGQHVTVWVAEGPDTVTVTVAVESEDGSSLRIVRDGATRFEVSEQAPHVAVAFTSGTLTITLWPNLAIDERTGG